MRQAEIVVDVIQGQLLAQAVLTFAEGGDASTDGGHMLADGEVHALDEGGIDLPATGRQSLVDRLQRAEHDPGPHVDQPATSHGLYHLRIEELWHRHPPGLRGRACGLAARWLYPLSETGQESRGVLLEAIRQEQRYKAWRQPLDHLMHDALGHGPAAFPDVKRQQEFA